MQDKKPPEEQPIDPTEFMRQFIEVTTKGNLFGEILASGNDAASNDA